MFGIYSKTYVDGNIFIGIFLLEFYFFIGIFIFRRYFWDFYF
jgi:hypothetical protein